MFDTRAWRSRGYIPHFDAGESIQFITFRLADSMPQHVLEKWRVELENNEITDADLRRRIETYLDQNYGSSALRDRRIAGLVQETLLKWDGERYKLFAWVIMTNHGHILLQNENGHSISSIMHSIKSFTAHEANRILGRKGKFWSTEYFDRYIRDQRHFSATIKYIKQNPVKSRLCRNAEDWEFSSAHFLGRSIASRSCRRGRLRSSQFVET